MAGFRKYIVLSCVHVLNVFILFQCTVEDIPSTVEISEREFVPQRATGRITGTVCSTAGHRHIHTYKHNITHTDACMRMYIVLRCVLNKVFLLPVGLCYQGYA